VFSFYADESGSADIFNDEQPWFVLLAIGLNDDNWEQIDDSVNGLKRAYFPGFWKQVEIHSNDIRRASRQKFPPNPFSSLTPEKREQFGIDLYNLIDALPFQFCAAAVNKRAAINQKGFSSTSELFQFTYTLLVERLHGWCEREKNIGRLFVDQQEHNLLGAKHGAIETDHYALQQSGSGWQNTTCIIERPYFHDSKRSNHTQLADILAYNVYRRYVHDDPQYLYFQKTMKKVRGNQKPDGSYYGLKIYP